MIRTEIGVVAMMLLALTLAARVSASDAWLGVPFHLSACMQLIALGGTISWLFKATDT